MHLHVTTNLDIDPWSDLYEKFPNLPDGAPLPEGHLTRVGMLPNGTSSGRAVVALLVEFEGKPVFVQVTWRIWQTLAAALAATPVAQLEEM